MTIVANSVKNFQVKVVANGEHELFVDEPESYGGDNTGPNPYSFLLSALAGCKIITTQMYAKRKQWPLEGIEITMSHSRVYEVDCENCENDTNAKIDLIETEISFKGELSDEQLARLLSISERCPVHRTLTSETKIVTKIV